MRDKKELVWRAALICLAFVGYGDTIGYIIAGMWLLVAVGDYVDYRVAKAEGR